MPDRDKHEIWILALGALAAAPVVAGVGLVVMTGLVAW